MTSQPGKQIPAIHTLSNTVRSKTTQEFKFVQLIQYDMENLFFEKSYTKWGGETISRPFPKKSKSSVSLDLQFKVLYSLFSLNVKSIEVIEIYLN